MTWERGSGATALTADEELMAALHRDHAAVLMAFVMRYERNRSAAEDVVQETLIRVWRRLDHLELGSGRVRSYLFTIARNVLTDRWRAERRRPTPVRLETVEGELGGSDESEAAMRALLVAQALAHLSPGHRDVVQALYFDARSVREVAELLGVPEGTVKSRSYHALRALRAALEEMGVIQ